MSIDVDTRPPSAQAQERYERPGLPPGYAVTPDHEIIAGAGRLAASLQARRPQNPS